MILGFSDIEYNKLIEFAKSKIPYDNIGQIDHRDIVNDVLIKYLDSSEEIEIFKIKKEIQSLCKVTGINERTSIVTHKETTRVCTCCRESFPVAMFYIVQRKKSNQQEVLYQCKTCHIKNVNSSPYRKSENGKSARKKATIKYITKKRSTDKDFVRREKQSAKKARAKYLLNNREKWNTYQRERAAKKRQEKLVITI